MWTHRNQDKEMHRIFKSTLVKKTFAWKDVKWIKIGKYYFYNNNECNTRSLNHYFPDKNEVFLVRSFECHTKDKRIEFTNLMRDYDPENKIFRNVEIMFADHDYCNARNNCSGSGGDFTCISDIRLATEEGFALRTIIDIEFCEIIIFISDALSLTIFIREYDDCSYAQGDENEY